MRDVDEWIAALAPASPPPARPPLPVRPRGRGFLASAALFAAGAIAALTVAAPPRPDARIDGDAPRPGTRGVEARVPVQLDLRMVVERDGGAVRLGDHGEAKVGERVWFRVGSAPASRASLWVDGPVGREIVAEVDAGPVPADVAVDGGLVAYRFDVPGDYRFHLSTAAGQCEDCPSVGVRVR